MNEVIETLSGALKELRSSCSDRKYYVRSEECEAAEREMSEAEQAFDRCREGLSETERQRLASYLDAMAHYHFEEEQRAYTQGIVDAILLLDGLGLLRHGIETDSLIEKIVN